MDTFDEKQPGDSRPRSLKTFIIERGCHELQVLSELRAQGWNDERLKDPLNDHFDKTRKKADESNADDDLSWLPVMESSLAQMDKQTQCIPYRKGLRFLDLGCCPGGFSKYVLTKNHKSRGVGVSLPVESGGHGLAIPSPECLRFKIHWGDMTYYDICSPMSRPAPENEPALSRTPFLPDGFQLAMLDGHHRRTQESPSTHKWDINRLLIAQLIIGIESLDPGGTLIVKFHHVESSLTSRLLYMIDKLSRMTIAFKPYVHATRGSFYAIGLGFGLGVYGRKRVNYLHHLKQVWWELTFGGPTGEGRWLEENDLDFIVDFDTLTHTYLDRLIRLGKGSWRVQGDALRKKFARIRSTARSPASLNDMI